MVWSRNKKKQKIERRNYREANANAQLVLSKIRGSSPNVTIKNMEERCETDG